MITSRRNPQILAAMKLYQRNHREAAGLTLVEGYRQVMRALQAGIAIDTLFFARELWLGENESALIESASAVGARLEETSGHVFERISIRERPDGLLALARLPRFQLDDLLERNAPDAPPLIVVVEGIEKPGNLGAILRSADGAGATGVIVCDRVTDISNPNVVRASVGTIFAQKIVECASAAAREWLARVTIPIVAATPAAPQNYTSADLSGAAAIVLGSEQYGLAAGWLAAPGAIAVAIPMRGIADSLNVAQAATLLLYEARRQRDLACGRDV